MAYPTIPAGSVGCRILLVSNIRINITQMRKGLKNYRSGAEVANSVNKIEELVTKRMKASSFYKEYKEGEVSGVIFVIPTDKGNLPFKLPARIEKVERLVSGRKQAERTAWANLRDWVDSQIALIETEQVKVEEIFLPYLITNAQTGTTFFDDIESGKARLPQISSGVQEGEVMP